MLKAQVYFGRREEIDNDHGISKFFSPKGDGMLPVDVTIRVGFYKKIGRKLDNEEGYFLQVHLYKIYLWVAY